MLANYIVGGMQVMTEFSNFERIEGEFQALIWWVGLG
jgi:hypothetical protein